MCKRLICLTVFVLARGLVAQTAEPNIVGHWKFDGASGTNVIDYSDNGNNGTIHGGASLDGSGQLTLDGDDDYVSLPIGAVINSLTNCSFVAWVDFSNSGGSWQRIFDFGNNTTENMFLTPRTGTTGPMRFAITTGGSIAEQQATAPQTLPSGLHRVILTIDADNDIIKMYLDSILVAQNTSATLTPSDLGNTSNNWLGRSQYSADGYFDGSYDEFIIYDYVLPDSEILGPFAYDPQPADESEDVLGQIVLSWSPGYGIDSHDIYFGTDFSDVNDANNSWPVGDSVYKGNQAFDDCDYYPGELAGDQTYYWRIDEVNEPNIAKGDVWSFTVFDYVLEDFEDYNNSSELNLAWVPGGSASVQLSTDISHKSQKSMKLDYANSSGDYYSTAKVTFGAVDNWDIDGIEALSIYFKGCAGNAPDELYVIIEDGDWIPSTAIVAYDGDLNDLKKEHWQRWDINLEEFVQNNPAFRLEQVISIAIAVGDTTNQQPGGSGTLYIDDISFKWVRCLDKNKPVADFDGDCDVDINDLKHLAQQWLDTDSDADMIEDGITDFKDYTVVADKWQGEYSDWPVPLDIDNFLTPVPFYDVNITGGLWAERMQVDRDVTIPHCWNKNETTTGRLSNFYNAINHTGSHQGYVFNDTDIYKTLEATAYSLRLFPDPTLEAYADDIIDIIGQVQWVDPDPNLDGYLDTLYSIPYPQPTSIYTNIGSNHEMYCAGHLFEAAVAYYQTTGKSKILDIAENFANNLNMVFGPGKRMDPPGHEEVEIGLMKLYDLTGDVNYLNLTKFFIDQRGNAAGHSLYGTYSQDHVPLVEQDEGVGHAVRAGYFYTGAADVARVNLDQDYMNSLMKIWDNVFSAKTYIIGGFGSDPSIEGFGDNYDLPNTSYCETCASIAFANWNHRMFLLTGDGRYLDVMERSMHNNILSGLSLSGDHFFYPNKLESSGDTRPDWYGCACCPPNLARFIMSIGEKAYAHNDQAVYVGLYMNGTAQIQLASNTVNLSVNTNYPWDGDIEITFMPGPAVSFPIYLRIPSWARNIPMPGNLYGYLDESSEQPTLLINNSPVELNIEKGFAKIEKTWTANDRIRLILPMPVRKVIAHPSVAADVNLVAVQRGPVVYCAEGIDNGGSVFDLKVNEEVEFNATYEPETLNGVVVLRSTAPEITLVPYYTWANRGSTPMKVWLGGTLEFDVSEGEMQGYWKLDESSGTSASDSSGKGMNGTCMNGLSFTTDSVPGKFDDAINFDGTNEYIDLPDGFSNFSKGVTVSVWAYPTAVKNYSRFIDLGNGSSSDNILFGREGTSNNLFFEIWEGGSNGGRVAASNTIELNKWQMFTATADASGNTKIYKDAQLKGYGTTGVANDIVRTANYIGRSNWGGDDYYEGYMDEVRVFDYAMDANGVQALYYGGRAENPSPAQDSTGISVNTSLSWIGGAAAAKYDVYLGTDYDTVANATETSDERVSRQSETTYVPPSPLDSATTYFWRIDGLTDSNEVVAGSGVVWNFTTAE